MKNKYLILTLALLLFFSAFNVNVLAQQKRNGSVKEYVSRINQPIGFKIYTPAIITLDLNYTQKDCQVSAYNVYKNNKKIYTTLQSKDRLVPIKKDQVELGRGFYNFQVGTIKKSSNSYCKQVPLKKDTALKVTVQCKSGNCFMDPMVLMQQQLQREQQQREIRQQNQRQQTMKMNDSFDLPNMNNPTQGNMFNVNSTMNNNFNNGMSGMMNGLP